MIKFLFRAVLLTGAVFLIIQYFFIRASDFRGFEREPQQIHVTDAPGNYVCLHFFNLIDFINAGDGIQLSRMSDIAKVEDLRRIFGHMVVGDGFGGEALLSYMMKCVPGDNHQKCLIYQLENKGFFAAGKPVFTTYTYKISLEFGGNAAITLTFPGDGRTKDAKFQKIEIHVLKEGNEEGFAKLIKNLEGKAFSGDMK